MPILRPAMRRSAVLALLALGSARPLTAQEIPPQPEPPVLGDLPLVPAEPPTPTADAPAAPAPTPPAPPPLPPPGSAPKDAWRVRADRAAFDPRTGVLTVDGGVFLSGPDRALGAQSATLDTRTGVLTAQGPVVMAEERQVTTCSSATLNVRTQKGTLHKVLVEVQGPMDAVTRDQVARLRKGVPLPRQAVARARTVEATGPGRFTLTDAYLTTCDCAEGQTAPFSVTAARADVVAGERATVWLPVFRVLDVPVFAAPAWVVPLKPRLSGLLFPQVRLQDGLWLQQPAYVTLGESADITLAPGVVTERGPRMFAEARAAPAEGTYVEAQATYQRDAKHLWSRRDPSRDVDPTGEGVPWRDLTGIKRSYTRQGELLRPDRFATHFLAHSHVGPLALATDVNLVSDRFVPGDFGVSLGDRVAPYLRSGAGLQFAWRHLSLAAAVTTYQDLQQPGVLLWGPASARLGHRVPLIRLTLQEFPITPAVAGMGPLLALRAQGGLDQEWLLGVGPTREPWAPPGRVSGATRAWVQPELVIPLRFSRFAGARASVGVRESVFLGQRGRLVDVTRVYTRNRVETELTGHLLPRRNLTHRIRPYAAHDGVLFTRHSADGASPWLDVWDRVRPYQSVGAGVDQVFTLEGVLGRTWTLQADAHAAVDVLTLRQSELRGGVAAQSRGMSTQLRVAVDPVGRELTFLQTGLDVGTGATPQVHVGYVRISRNTPRFMMGGVDDLLGGTRLDGPTLLNGADRLDASVALPLSIFRVDYGVEVAFPGVETSVAGLQKGPPPVQPQPITHGGGLTVQGDCRCWSAGARMRFWPGRTVPDVGVQFSLNGPDGQLQLFR